MGGFARDHKGRLRARWHVGRRRGRTGVAVIVVVLLTIAAVLTSCGTAASVSDAGTVSTTEETTTTTLPPTTTTTKPPSTATSSPTTTEIVTTTTTEATTTTTDSMVVSVYFARDEKLAVAHRIVPKTTATGKAAMLALLEGPTPDEKQVGMSSSIPAGTRFLGLDVQNGVATIDLSKEYESGGGSLSMATRLAQVVYTLTQFASVTRVTFQLDGQPVNVFGGEGIVLDKPVGRSAYEELTPAIMVESVGVGDNVKSPLLVWGTANVFEAVFKIDVVDWDGRIIAEQTVHASSGTGTRGAFDISVPFAVDKPGRGSLIVFSQSPKDGSHANVVEIPVFLTN
jgi:germination protein M